MKEGIVKKWFLGLEVGTKCFVDFESNLSSNSIGIYDENKNFIVYIFNREEVEECVSFNG